MEGTNYLGNDYSIGALNNFKYFVDHAREAISGEQYLQKDRRSKHLILIVLILYLKRSHFFFKFQCNRNINSIIVKVNFSQPPGIPLLPTPAVPPLQPSYRSDNKQNNNYQVGLFSFCFPISLRA